MELDKDAIPSYYQYEYFLSFDLIKFDFIVDKIKKEVSEFRGDFIEKLKAKKAEDSEIISIGLGICIDQDALLRIIGNSNENFINLYKKLGSEYLNGVHIILRNNGVLIKEK